VRRASAILVATVGLLAGPRLLGGASPAVAAAPDAAGGSQLERLLEEGLASLEKGNFTAAAKSFRRADELAKGASHHAHLGLAEAYLKLADYDRAIKQAERALALTEDVGVRARAEGLRGFALLVRHRYGRYSGPAGQEARQEDLRRAEQAWRAVLDLTRGEENIARYHLADALFAEERYDEAKAGLDEYVAHGGSITATPEAESLACLLTAGAEGARPAQDEELTPPVKVRSAVPDIPQQARGIRGMVMLRAIIGTAGEVRCVKPIKGLPQGLTEAAVEAVRQWRFTPATLGGKPVQVFYSVTIRFESH